MLRYKEKDDSPLDNPPGICKPMQSSAGGGDEDALRDTSPERECELPRERLPPSCQRCSGESASDAMSEIGSLHAKRLTHVAAPARTSASRQNRAADATRGDKPAAKRSSRHRSPREGSSRHRSPRGEGGSSARDGHSKGKSKSGRKSHRPSGSRKDPCARSRHRDGDGKDGALFKGGGTAISSDWLEEDDETETVVLGACDDDGVFCAPRTSSAHRDGDDAMTLVSDTLIAAVDQSRRKQLESHRVLE